jgi:hypothetical protein
MWRDGAKGEASLAAQATRLAGFLYRLRILSKEEQGP